MVNEDHGPQSVKVQEAFDAVAANIATFTTIPYTDEQTAKRDVREGKVDAAIIIPPQYSRAVYARMRRGSGWWWTTRIRYERQHRGRDAVAGGRAEPAGDSQAHCDRVALEIVELYPTRST